MIKTLKTRLKEEMKARGIKIPGLSAITGIPKDRIYAWYRDNSTPKAEDQERLEKWLSGEISNKVEENGNGDLGTLDSQSVKKEISADASLQAIKNLTETGKIHAENYRVMVSNEARLISLLEKSTVDSAKDNGVASPKVMSGILVAMAKIASGTRWHSEEEAIRELGRLLSPQADESKKIKDSRVG